MSGFADEARQRRRHWVEVSGDTGLWLDMNGLLISTGDGHGTYKNAPTRVAGMTISRVLYGSEVPYELQPMGVYTAKQLGLTFIPLASPAPDPVAREESGIGNQMDAATAPVVDTGAEARSLFHLLGLGNLLRWKRGQVDASVGFNAGRKPIQQLWLYCLNLVRVVVESELGGRVNPHRDRARSIPIASNTGSEEEPSTSRNTCSDRQFKMPQELVLKFERYVAASETVEQVTHENSLSVGAVGTVHGPDVPRPTVRDVTDTRAVPFPSARVGGLQDGAAVPPIAAASPPGGDAASSPKQAASLPPSEDRASTDVKVIVQDKPGTASRFPGDRRVSTTEVRFFKKTGWFAKSRSTPYVTTVFRMRARAVVLVCAYTLGMWIGQLLWPVLAGLGWGQ